MLKKNSKNPGKSFEFEVPEIYNMDDLGYMSDEVIEDRANRLENERNRILSTSRDPRLWEVEIAYVRREQQLRHTRAELHKEYVKKFNVDLSNVDVDFNASVEHKNGLN